MEDFSKITGVEISDFPGEFPDTRPLQTLSLLYTLENKSLLEYRLLSTNGFLWEVNAEWIVLLNMPVLTHGGLICIFCNSVLEMDTEWIYTYLFSVHFQAETILWQYSRPYSCIHLMIYFLECRTLEFGMNAYGIDPLIHSQTGALVHRKIV